MRNWKDKIDSIKARADFLKRLYAQETENLEASEKALEVAQEAQQHLQIIAQMVQREMHNRIVSIASKCLTAVFGEAYELVIDFVRIRGKTEARLIYKKGDQEVDPMTDSGGVMDVASLSLRLASLILSKPARRKFIVMDEPFRMVSSSNLPKLAKAIEILSKELGVQFLIVTHNEELLIGKVIRL